jgi:glycosyltransferase A (GT-A) superfamily protein (DUF2064 family)
MSEGSKTFARKKLGGARGSTEAARALLLHTVAAAESVGELVVCAPAGTDAAMLGGARAHWIRQGSGSLGARIAAAVVEVERRFGTSRPLILVGDDCPGLSADALDEVLDRMAAGAQSVVGRARDGGFWLLALASWDARLFASLASQVGWNGAGAFADLLVFLRASFPADPALLAERTDLDHAGDLADAVRAAGDPSLRASLAAVKPGLSAPVEEEWSLPPAEADGAHLPRPPPRA